MKLTLLHESRRLAVRAAFGIGTVDAVGDGGGNKLEKGHQQQSDRDDADDRIEDGGEIESVSDVLEQMTHRGFDVKGAADSNKDRSYDEEERRQADA